MLSAEDKFNRVSALKEFLVQVRPLGVSLNSTKQGQCQIQIEPNEKQNPYRTACGLKALTQAVLEATKVLKEMPLFKGSTDDPNNDKTRHP